MRYWGCFLGVRRNCGGGLACGVSVFLVRAQEVISAPVSSSDFGSVSKGTIVVS